MPNDGVIKRFPKHRSVAGLWNSDCVALGAKKKTKKKIFLMICSTN